MHLNCYARSQSGSTASTTALHHVDTKSTLAQDDEHTNMNSDATAQVQAPPSTIPESLSLESNAITTKSNRNRAKAKSDHAKYELTNQQNC